MVLSEFVHRQRLKSLERQAIKEATIVRRLAEKEQIRKRIRALEKSRAKLEKLRGPKPEAVREINRLIRFGRKRFGRLSA